MTTGTTFLLRAVAMGSCAILSGCFSPLKERAPSDGDLPAAIDGTVSSSNAAFNAAVSHARFGRIQEAIEEYRKAISEDPDDAMAHYGLGVAYVLSGDHSAAMEESEALLGLNGELAGRLRALALKKEKSSREIASREKAVRLRPGSSAAYFKLGKTYADHGRYSAAVEAFKQASRISPENARIYYEMGRAYSGLGSLPEAAEAFEQAVGIRPDYAPAYYELGVARAKLGNHQEAREAYERTISLDPDDPDARYLLGVTYGKLGDPARAIELFEEAIRIDPGYAEAYYGIGLIFLGLGDARRALEAQEKLKQLDDARAERLFAMIFPGAVDGE